MTQERAKELLNKLFITKKRDNGEEFICYNDEGDKLGAFEKGTDLNLLYEAVSGVMFNSGLSHGFSYEIASRAVDIVAEMEDITDGEEDLTEAIDGAVPIYTFDLMEIYKADSASVDEAAEEYGDRKSVV